MSIAMHMSSILKINGFLFSITRNNVAKLTFHLKNITSPHLNNSKQLAQTSNKNETQPHHP